MGVAKGDLRVQLPAARCFLREGSAVVPLHTVLVDLLHLFLEGLHLGGGIAESRPLILLLRRDGHRLHLLQIGLVGLVSRTVVAHDLIQALAQSAVVHGIVAHRPLLGAFLPHFAPQPTLVFELAHHRFETSASDARFAFDAPLRIVKRFEMKHIGLLHQQPIEEHHFVGREQIVAKTNDVDAHRGFDLREHRSTRKRGIHVFKLDFRHLPDGEIEQARCFSLNIDEVWSKGSHLSANATRGRRTFVRGETPFDRNARAACRPPIECGAQSTAS